MKKYTFIIAVVAIVVIGGFFLMNTSGNEADDISESTSKTISYNNTIIESEDANRTISYENQRVPENKISLQ